MENNNKNISINENTKYISILNKIRHKPIIFEFIFSYIKSNPFTITYLIEKDKFLHNGINLFFNKFKKSNTLSKDLNNNLNILSFFKSFKDKIIYSNYINLFEENLVGNNPNPSFIEFKTKYIVEEISEENKKKKFNKNIPVISELNDIHYQINKYLKNIQLAYLPKKNNKTGKFYYDGSYIEENIINNKNILKQEIDVLYCIIDDNEYYKDIKSIDKNVILVNKIYFKYIKGKKKINIYNAIKNYLKKINGNNIKEIILGKEFFKGEKEKCNDNYFNYKFPIMDCVYEEVFFHNKNINLPDRAKINCVLDEFEGNLLKFVLGLSLLFDSININILGVKVIDSRFPNKIKDESKTFKIKYIILKIYDFSFLENEKLKEYLENNKHASIMIYVNENAMKYNSDKYFNSNIESSILKDRDYIFYFERPIEFNFYGYSTKITTKGNLILLERYKNKFDLEEYIENFNEYLFLFKKYKSIEYIDNRIYFFNKFCFLSDDFKILISFLVDYNNIIIDFNENNEQSEKEIYNFKRNKFNNIIKHLGPKINNIYFLNDYIKNITFENNINKIYMIDMKSENFRNNEGLIETKCLNIKLNEKHPYGNLTDKYNYIKSENNHNKKGKNKDKKAEKKRKENLYKNEEEDEDFYEDEYDIYDKDCYY